MTTVKDFVHTGSMESSIMRLKFELDTSRCVFSVAEYGRITEWHQCHAKPVETIDGYGFCKRHAKHVNHALGRTESSKIRFAARFRDGNPTLLELEVISETNKTIFVKSSKTILGQGYEISSGNNRKDSEHIRPYHFFDDKNDAISFLVGKAYDRMLWLSSESYSAEEMHKKLLSMWYSEKSK